MNLPVRQEEVPILEKEELDLPEARIADPEAVGLGPVPAFGQGEVEGGPSRAVDLDRLVGCSGGVIDELHGDEVDADGVVDAHKLVVRDAKDDRSGLGDVERRRVSGGVAAGTEDIELREALPGLRRQHHIGKDDCGYDDACGESHGDAPIEQTGLVPYRHCEFDGGSKPPLRRQAHAAPVRGTADACGEYGDRRNEGREANSPGRVVEEEAEERDHRDAQPERQGNPLDPVDFRLLRPEGAGEQCCHENVAWEEEDEEDREEIADIEREEYGGHHRRVANGNVEVPGLFLKM